MPLENQDRPPSPDKKDKEPKPQSVAFLFAGQALPPSDIIQYASLLAQYNQQLTQTNLRLAETAFRKVNNVSNFDLQATLSDPDSAFFQQTRFVQPVIYALSVTAYDIFNRHADKKKVVPSLVAGHSLGKLSALTAADVFPYEQGVLLVAQRGNVMEKASKTSESRLISIHGLDEDAIKQLCEETGAEIALINGPKLIVVGSAKAKVADVRNAATTIGAKRSQELPAAAAFHTSFMQEAAQEFDRVLRTYAFSDPTIPVIANITGDKTMTATAIRNHLVESMINPVQWARSVQTMKDADVFVELGPGNTLVQLNKANGIPAHQSHGLQDALKLAA